MANNPSTTKQVLVLRRDLSMRKGKLVAQGAHVSLNAVLGMGKLLDGVLHLPITPVLADWLNGLHTKVTLGVDSEAELHALHAQAIAAGLPCSIVQDQGFTDLSEPTYTAVAIGPAELPQVDAITGHLRPY